MAPASKNNRGSSGSIQGSSQAESYRRDATENERPRHTAPIPSIPSGGGSSTVDPSAKGGADSGSVNSK